MIRNNLRISIFSYCREATSSEKQFVLITSDPKKGCVASLGFGKAHFLNLAEGCHSPRYVMHELFHTLGVDHYHQRSDRDKYVKIHWENIPKKMHFAYCKVANGGKSIYGGYT